MNPREFPPPGDILLPNDHRLIYVPANTWHCVLCQPAGGEGAYTTVDWIGAGQGPDGRCTRCGAKYVLARPGEHVPAPDEQH